MEFTAETIAGFLGGEISGDNNAKVWTVSKIEEGSEGSLSFLANPKYEPYIYESDSSIIIVNRSFEPQKPVKSTLIKVDDAYACFAKLLEMYAANKPRKSGISPQASISEYATIGQDCYIGQFAVIEDGVKTGANCRIYPQVYLGDNVHLGDNVTLYPGVKIYEDCVIGNNVTIHAGSVIGGDGFGFAPQEDGSFSKIPQLGNVVIEDDVEIGANTTIDRATMGSTYIRKGAKLDNLIQIGHNVDFGSNTVAAAQVGVAGSTKIGANCMFGGQVGISGHIKIGDGVQVGSQSGIVNNVEAGKVVMGSPIMPYLQHHRASAVYRNLPDLQRVVYKMKHQLEEILEQQK